jgi:uncharacterized protein YciI
MTTKPNPDAGENQVTTLEQLLKETEGMLHKRLYVIFTKPVPGNEALIEEVTPEHLEFQVKLEEKGIMFAAGPFLNQDEETAPEEGMIIYRAASLQAARDIADADPMHSSGARTYIVRPWLVNEGGFNLSVRFSNGSFELD